MKTIFNLQFTIYKRGFTLIELLVVISIIGILSAFLMANFVGFRQRARDGVRKSDLRQIQAALELHRSDIGEYPATLPACGAPLTDGAPTPVTYMQKIPCDPLNTSPYYVYTYSSNKATYSIISCLENIKDSQKDAANVAPCHGATNVSYTLENP